VYLIRNPRVKCVALLSCRGCFLRSLATA